MEDLESDDESHDLPQWGRHCESEEEESEESDSESEGSERMASPEADDDQCEYT